ncbi:tetratricopeptide repeat protein [Longimicrobium terrae]|uniref:Tetratricopeptide (TPR) repeat protein n=1 Tax=Longimicrobium terrae TaxID=1639882 RepID=A0A841GZQ8_9BACT|nr:tetratricopeptide repeat protein [Longimicrobium terrae]MBB4636841.1 tetratricopeptide (TPR) repeat protein [Longimicrobium terrae]MBB6071159.1 tetratricopeptide (TPR) repeat protein [Longimicrobium terrae]NNC29208.1 tetratricopeptide repeat protein [Longimicrobium terrae]
MTPSALPPLTLDEARALRAAGEWRVLARRAAEVPADVLAAEPEMAYAVAAALRQTGETARALEMGAFAEAGARRRGDRRLAAEAVNLLGNALFEAGRMDEAQARFEELLAYAVEWSDQPFAARASNNLGILCNVRGRRDQALVNYQRAVAAYQAAGNVLGLAQTHHNLGITFRDLGFADDADAHCLRAIQLAGSVSDATGAASATDAETVIALAETERAFLRARAGDGELAEAMGRRALRRFERIGDPRGRADALRVLAAAARAMADDDEALRRLDAALDVPGAGGYPLLVAEVQRDRGLLLRDLGRLADARRALDESAAAFAGVGAAAEAEAVATIARALTGDDGDHQRP